jgi:hypothetical protein
MSCGSCVSIMITFGGLDRTSLEHGRQSHALAHALVAHAFHDAAMHCELHALQRVSPCICGVCIGNFRLHASKTHALQSGVCIAIWPSHKSRQTVYLWPHLKHAQNLLRGFSSKFQRTSFWCPKRGHQIV